MSSSYQINSIFRKFFSKLIVSRFLSQIKPFSMQATIWQNFIDFSSVSVYHDAELSRQSKKRRVRHPLNWTIALSSSDMYPSLPVRLS